MTENMTPQDAILALKAIEDEMDTVLSVRAYHAVQMGVEALEKQIPMSMKEEVDISGRPIRVCGNCGDAPGSGEFCRWCGQRIKR